MKHNKVLYIVAATALLTGCSTNNYKDFSGSETSSSNENSPSSTTYSYSDINPDSSFTKAEYTDSDTLVATIILDGDTASISGDTSTSVSVNSDGDVVISAIGTYLIEGNSLFNKHILVTAATKDEWVELILNGVGISTSSGNAPIYSAGKSKLKIKKYKGSTNYIYDGRSTDSDSYTGDDTAAIFSDKALKVVGEGSLTVITTFNNGIGSDKGVSLKNGTLTIVSKNNCIKSNKSITIGEVSDGVSEGGKFLFQSNNGQCFKSDYDNEDTTTGTIDIVDGEFILKAKQDGFEAEGKITISGGKFELTTNGGSSGTLDKVNGDSCKGIKSDLDITISGGEFHINSLDDAIHCNGSISISGGTFDIYSGDDGIHADDTFTLTDGTISISKSYEGIEAETLNFNGGSTSIVSSDDGINAAGGSDTSSTDVRPWGDSSTGTLNIDGGYLFVNASGDGLDSNGNINVTGGYTVVAGPVSDGDGPLDIGDGGSYALTQSGGTLIAYGSSGMAINASKGSQKTLLFKHNSSIDSIYYYVLKDSSNNIISVINPYKSTSSLYYSSSSLANLTYTLSYVKTSDVSVTLSEIYKGVYSSSSDINNLTNIGSINLSSTTNGNYGSSQGGGGGHGGPGGR